MEKNPEITSIFKRKQDEMCTFLKKCKFAPIKDETFKDQFP